ncbi:MAG: DnaJ like chaperone protein, partial [Bacteriovoracaceae bacterium]
FIKIKELIELISSEAHLYHSLSPLPDLKGKNDIKGALSLFGLKEDATAEQIKKAYKKISMLKHPDRLASKGIPKAFEDIAHENFTRIQSAYELIKK